MTVNVTVLSSIPTCGVKKPFGNKTKHGVNFCYSKCFQKVRKGVPLPTLLYAGKIFNRV